MKKLYLLNIIAIIALGIFIHSCKKDNQEVPEDNTYTQTQQSTDESLMNNESEISLNEINTSLSGVSFGKAGTIAGATINDSSFINDKKIIITYAGLSTDGKRNRTGEIIVQLSIGDNWSQAGALLTITYNNLRISNTSSKKSILFNGTLQITNESGGRAFVASIVTHIVRSSNMKVSFDNGSIANWQIARKRVITASNGNYEITLTGDTSLSGNSNIMVWGTNREGNAFYTQIANPIVFNNTCYGLPLSGVKIHKGIASEITVTFGVDANGNTISGTCPYGYKITWTNARNVDRTVIIAY